MANANASHELYLRRFVGFIMIRLISFRNVCYGNHSRNLYILFFFRNVGLPGSLSSITELYFTDLTISWGNFYLLLDADDAYFIRDFLVRCFNCNIRYTYSFFIRT